MSIIPIITVKQLLSVLLRAGFKIIRQKGSHLRLIHPVTGRATTLAMHAEDLSRMMIMKILKQAGISAKDFLKIFKINLCKAQEK